MTSNNVKAIIKLIGHQAAIRLIRSKGGRDLGFPQVKHLHDLHWLVVLVGMDNAISLCTRFNGLKIKLPIEVNALLQIRNEAIIEDYKQGLTKSKLAAKYQVDRRLVQSIVKAIPKGQRDE